MAAPDAARGMIVKAYVVLHDPDTENAELVQALQDHVKAAIAPVQVPTRDRVRAVTAARRYRQTATLRASSTGSRCASLGGERLEAPISQIETVNGAEALLEMFRTQGADYIFCSPIAAWAPLWEALAKRKATTNIENSEISELPSRDSGSRSGSGLLQGHREDTGGPAPTGLGVLHGAMAMRSAFHEHIPMVIVSPDTLSHGAKPDLDPGPEWPTLLVDLSGPVRNSETVTKWAKEVKTSSDLAADVRRAWYFAESVPRGPTLLGVPFDLLMSQMEMPQGNKTKASPLVAPTDNLREVTGLLMRSHAPLIVTEHAARTPQDQAALVAIAEGIGAPVFEYWMPMYVNFPRAHPLYATDPIEAHLKDADCILVIGATAPGILRKPHFRKAAGSFTSRRTR